MAQLFQTSLGALVAIVMVVVSHFLGQHGERKRRTAEDQRRWHEERMRLSSSLIAACLKVERVLDTAVCFTPSGRSLCEENGITSIVHWNDSMLTDDFDEVALSIVREALDEHHEVYESMEGTEASLRLLTPPQIGEAIGALLMATLDVAVVAERLGPCEAGYEALDRLKDARAQFTAQAQRLLGMVEWAEMHLTDLSIQRHPSVRSTLTAK